PRALRRNGPRAFTLAPARPRSPGIRLPVLLAAVGELAGADGVGILEVIRRDRQVERRRRAVHDPAGEVIAGAVARAEKSARPARRQVRGIELRPVLRNASQVRTDADDHEVLRIDGPRDRIPTREV